MKNANFIFHFLILVTLIITISCNSKPLANSDSQQMSNQIENGKNDSMPKPGNMTATSSDPTPVDQKNMVNYVGEDSSSITALYRFDDQEYGVVNIMRKGKPDLVLKQSGDANSGSTEYSDGHSSWKVSKDEATLNENGQEKHYKIVQ